jgi:hypothetical protein
MAVAMQLPSPPPPSPLLPSQSICCHIATVLSSDVAAIPTATMGAPVNPATSPTARASPAITAAYTVLPANMQNASRVGAIEVSSFRVSFIFVVIVSQAQGITKNKINRCHL